MWAGTCCLESKSTIWQRQSGMRLPLKTERVLAGDGREAKERAVLIGRQTSRDGVQHNVYYDAVQHGWKIRRATGIERFIVLFTQMRKYRCAGLWLHVPSARSASCAAWIRYLCGRACFRKPALMGWTPMAMGSRQGDPCSPHETGPVRIVIADDEALSRRLTQRTLESAGLRRRCRRERMPGGGVPLQCRRSATRAPRLGNARARRAWGLPRYTRPQGPALYLHYSLDREGFQG